MRRAINHLDYEVWRKNSLESHRCAGRPAGLLTLSLPDRGEEIMQTGTEIPVTFGSRSWGKRRGFTTPQEPQVICFARSFAFSDHREKPFRAVDSGKAREKDKLRAWQGCRSAEADYC